MNQQTAAILGAAIAALVAFSVALYNSRRQSKLEYEKWLRTREDQIDKDFRLAVADLTRRIVQGTHQIIWLAWKAKNEATNLTEEDFVMYDKRMGELFPDIVGSRIIVAALNRKVHDEITPFVKRLYVLDEEVAKARILFRKMPEKGIATLADCFDKTISFDSELLMRVTDIVGLNRKEDLFVQKPAPNNSLNPTPR